MLFRRTAIPLQDDPCTNDGAHFGATPQCPDPQDPNAKVLSLAELFAELQDVYYLWGSLYTVWPIKEVYKYASPDLLQQMQRGLSAFLPSEVIYKLNADQLIDAAFAITGLTTYNNLHESIRAIDIHPNTARAIALGNITVDCDQDNPFREAYYNARFTPEEQLTIHKDIVSAAVATWPDQYGAVSAALNAAD